MKNFKAFSHWLIVLIVMSCNTDEHRNAEPEGDFSNTLTQEEISRARLSPEILWKFGRVGDMQLAPDGSTVLYTLTRFDAKSDNSHTWIFSVPSQGGVSANLTGNFASCSNPRWIDNNHIVFLSKTDDRNKIWQMNSDGSAKEVVSDIGGDINAFGIAPGGKKIFYLQDVKMDQTTQDRYPDLPLAKGMIFEDMMYRHWDSWHDHAYSHIFIADFANGRINQGKDIMEGEPYDSPLPPYFNIEEIAWNHNGTKLAFTCKKLKGRDFSKSTNSEIYLYDESGSITNITEGMPGYEKYPVFSPDGSIVAFMSMETPGYEADKERLFLYDIDKRTRINLTEQLDQNAAHFNWSADGSKIFFISGTRATYQVYEISV
ncbi:MAG TPA: peptidase S9, partial [Bacteroidales bacterium]|nr:peptidase S9 [Bacteroidales bacterium]